MKMTNDEQSLRHRLCKQRKLRTITEKQIVALRIAQDTGMVSASDVYRTVNPRYSLRGHYNFGTCMLGLIRRGLIEETPLKRETVYRRDRAKYYKLTTCGQEFMDEYNRLSVLL